jgi:hypothetical protein
VHLYLYIRKKSCVPHGGLRGERVKRVKRVNAPMQRDVRGNEQMQREVRGNEQMQRDVRGNAPHDGFCR